MMLHLDSLLSFALQFREWREDFPATNTQRDHFLGKMFLKHHIHYQLVLENTNTKKKVLSNTKHFPL